MTTLLEIEAAIKQLPESEKSGCSPVGSSVGSADAPMTHRENWIARSLKPKQTSPLTK